MSSEYENQIGKNPQSIELHGIYKLHPGQVELGLDYLIDQRRRPLFQKHKKGEATLEDEWQLRALHAVSLILDSNRRTFERPLERESDYRGAVEATLRYMRFLGYPETDLTAQGIITANEKLMEEFCSDVGLQPSIYLDFTERHQLFFFLRELDILMDIYDEFPTFEQYSAVLNRLGLKKFKKRKTWGRRGGKRRLDTLPR